MGWLTDSAYRWLAVTIITIYLIIFYFKYRRYLRNKGRFFYVIQHKLDYAFFLLAGIYLAIILIIFHLIFTSIRNYNLLLNYSQQLVQNACPGGKIEKNPKLFNELYHIQHTLIQMDHSRLFQLQHYITTDKYYSGEQIRQQLWQCYVILNQEVIVDSLKYKLEQQLAVYLKYANSHANRMLLFDSTYDYLMAYLMLSDTSKIDKHFLVDILSEQIFKPDGISSEQWDQQSTELIAYYIDNLLERKEWQLSLDYRLVIDVRTQLVHDTNFRNSEAVIYQRLLKQASQIYNGVSVRRLLNGVDSQMLFESNVDIPGIFTRQAWEGYIRKEIDQAAIAAVPEEVDWVLGKEGVNSLQILSRNELRLALINRYLTDYSVVWQNFLNNLRWRKASTLTESIDQLQLMVDPNESPFIALMKEINEQSNISYSIELNSSQLMAAFPENTSMGRLKSLFNKTNEGNAEKPLLNNYLALVTISYQKLVSVAENRESDKSKLSMFDLVFKEDATVFYQTRYYGKQIAEYLGSDWQRFANNMFVLPVEQAWQSILKPTVDNINHDWQNSVVASWNQNLGYYPFSQSVKDIPLARLNRLLTDGGVIDLFIDHELAGLLVQNDGVWTAKPLLNSDIRFNPQFLNILNRLVIIKNSWPKDGSGVFSFELLPKEGKNINGIKLLVNGQEISFDKTKPSWRSLQWPKDSRQPMTELQWNGYDSGWRRYEESRGTLGFLRLLEKARTKVLDNRRYLISWKASDGNMIEFELKAANGRGPLALLQLKGLSLPSSIFEYTNAEMFKKDDNDKERSDNP